MMRTQFEANDPAHQAMQELLPWFVNGTLSGEQLAMVGDHLLGCAQCRQDVEWQRSVAAAGPAAPELDMERALGRLMPRLEARAAPQRRPSWFARGWMPWALAGQGALIAVLAAVMVAAPDTRQPDYRVLGAGPATAAGNMVVAFRPEATLADLQRLTRANGARIVDGPTVTGAYVLEVDAARQAQVAAAFKADPAVLLAEPLGAGGGQ
jgi:hypothetical protein